MIKSTTTVKEITERHRYCDICESPAKTYCCKCNKDLCNKDVCHEDDDIGDYRGDCYCKHCWDVGEVYRTRIAENEALIDQWEEEWMAKCKNSEHEE